MFKKMVVQKRRELVKAYEAQEKRIKELKSQGQSKKKAEAKQKDALSRKQQKNQVRKLTPGQWDKKKWFLGFFDIKIVLDVVRCVPIGLCTKQNAYKNSAY